MEEKIKAIISLFTKIPKEQITDLTPVDRSVINSSIMLHRLYAQLLMEGIVVEDYWDIKNFGDLKKRIAGNNNTINYIDLDVENKVKSFSSSPRLTQPGIGIDIEDIGSMPIVDDIREDLFYKMNFATTEMAYCILQNDPYASLGGLFAAKEAIVKADENYKRTAFVDIIIDHTVDGKPVYKNIHLSISHTKNLVVAVAIQHQPAIISSESVFSNQPNQQTTLILLCILALGASLVAIIISVQHFI